MELPTVGSLWISNRRWHRNIVFVVKQIDPSRYFQAIIAVSDYHSDIDYRYYYSLDEFNLYFNPYLATI